MAYNDTGYNTVAYNSEGTVSDGGTTSPTATVSTTETASATESGTISATGSLSTTELREALESGTITSTVSLALNLRGGYQQGYNTVAYNQQEGGAFADEFGQLVSNVSFAATDSGEATESGTVTVTATNNTVETARATESGTVTVNATLAAVERAGAVYQRIFSRSVDLSFTKSLIVEFDEDKRMTEIQAIDDTLTDETRVLEFTAEDNGTAKDISGGKISWSLAEGGNVILSDSDPEVSTSIVDGPNGRFDVTIDGFDVDPGGYRQRVEVVDTQGKVTRSNGPYRIREF